MPPKRPSLDPDAAPETTTSPAAAAGSSAASSTSDIGGGLVGDPGPGFDPLEKLEQLPEVGPELPEVVPAVSEEQVRTGLLTFGDGVHAAVGVGEFDWVMTERDLARIAPPLARIVNRHEQLRVVAAHSDEAAVAVGAGLWAWRSLLERRAVQAAHAAEPDVQPPPTAGGEPPAATAVVETPPDYVTAADRIRASRPEGA